MVPPVKVPFVCRSASGAEVRNCDQREASSRKREEFASRRTSMGYAQLTWRRYLAYDTDMKVSFPLEKQDALTMPVCLIRRAAMAYVGISAKSLFLCLARLSDEENWTMGDFLKAEAVERIVVRRRLRNLQK